jgi:hypothetical protein
MQPVPKAALRARAGAGWEKTLGILACNLNRFPSERNVREVEAAPQFEQYGSARLALRQAMPYKDV